MQRNEQEQLTAVPLTRADERTYVLTPENRSIISRYGSVAPSDIDGMRYWIVDPKRSAFMIPIPPFEVREESNLYFVVCGRLHAVLELMKRPPEPPSAFIVESNIQDVPDREALEYVVVEAFRIGGRFCHSDPTGYYSDLAIKRKR